MWLEMTDMIDASDIFKLTHIHIGIFTFFLFYTSLTDSIFHKTFLTVFFKFNYHKKERFSTLDKIMTSNKISMIWSNQILAIFNKTLSFKGMGVSSFAIIFMKLKLEWHSIIFTSLGGIAGIIFGEFNCKSFKLFFKINHHF